MFLKLAGAQLVASAEQRRAMGLDHWIDGTMGIHRSGASTVVVAPNGPNLALHVFEGDVCGADLASGLVTEPATSGSDILGLPDDVRHASGGPLHHDAASGLLFLLYHGEYFENGDYRDYYSFLGLAVSEDGRTFRDLGPIVTSDVDRGDPARHRPVELGPGSLAVHEGCFDIYFSDRGYGCVRRHLSIARASLTDVVDAALQGRAPSFAKYLHGGFTESGVGGRSSDLLGHTNLWVGWYATIRHAGSGHLLLLFSTARRASDGPPHWDYGASISPDGIRWTAPVPLLERPETEEILYLSLDSGEQDQNVTTTDSFDLYRVRARARYRWDDAMVERIAVSVDADSLQRMGAEADTGDELLLRACTEDDRAAVIALCRASLGWDEDDPNEAFFTWKHDKNPFGASPAWVAEAPDGSLVGLRVFLRWRFRKPDGRTLSAVRAVDTATHPDWQGRGIFTRLTSGAIPELHEMGVDAVFNTPNDKSRPGYLKMGWSVVGRVPVAVRPTSFRSPTTMLRSRTAAELWSEPCDVGLPATDLLADETSIAKLLARRERSSTMETERSVEYLRWRYSFDRLRYRAVPIGDDPSDGIVVFRMRRRGDALECAVVDVIVADGKSARGAIGYIARRSGADYLLRCAGPRGMIEGFVPAPQFGPVLTWRPVESAEVPELAELKLSLGDVELF